MKIMPLSTSVPSHLQERINIVVFGASGFTGKHVVKEMSRIGRSYPEITWAVAGRDRVKLEGVLQDVSNKIGIDLSQMKIIIADVNNKESLKRMCNQAEVLINCCGPFVKYGESVVSSAIECQTHYVDVSGETQFIECLEQYYDQKAKEANIFIINACGLSSVPADLGVLYLEEHFNGTVHVVVSYLITHFPPKMMAKSRCNGIVRYSSWESVINSMAYISLSKMRQNSIKTEPEVKQRCLIHKNLNKWCIPFPGADSSVVSRTSRHLSLTRKRTLHYLPYITFPSILSATGAIIAAFLLFVLSKISWTRNFMLKYPRLCSFGVVTYGDPKEGVMDDSCFQYEMIANGWDKDTDVTDKMNKTLVARVTVSGVDPAYVGTAVTIILSAITILKEKHKMPSVGGVLTPGIAFRNTSLLKYLQENNITFEIIDSNSIKI